MNIKISKGVYLNGIAFDLVILGSCELYRNILLLYEAHPFGCPEYFVIYMIKHIPPTL